MKVNQNILSKNRHNRYWWTQQILVGTTDIDFEVMSSERYGL